METDLQAVLLEQCPRAHQGVPPTRPTAPYVTWRAIGGMSLRYLDNTPADTRNTLVQVEAWAATPLAALTLIRSIEEGLCASAAFTAEPKGEPDDDYDEQVKLYGAIQRFSIYAART